MTDFTECTLKVGIVPLRAALLSVVPHADPPKLGDEDLTLARVRFIAGRSELLIVATNESKDGKSSAQAAVPIEADSRREVFAPDDGPFIVDMHPAKVRDIARQIKPVKADKDGDPGPTATGWADLTLELDHATVADVSGLWPGTRLTVPLLDYRVEYPDVPAVIGRALEQADGKFKPLCLSAGVASRFETAAEQYEAELQWEPTGTADSSGYVVLCGDYFAGAVETNHGSAGGVKARSRRRIRHLERAGLGQQLAAI